ncbi:MAG TPA: TolC family protein [Candidatus Acidoferrales bacterium]|nr:TolC family protein [Candidatus Acidoferrales bacterium]
MRPVSLALALALAAAPGAGALTLDECLDLARHHAPSLQVSDAGIARAARAIAEARAALAPTLRLDASLVENSEAPHIAITLPHQPTQAFPIGQATAVDARGIAQLPLFDRQDRALVRAAEEAHTGQLRGREQADADLVLRVSTAFYQALAADRLQLAAEATVDSARAHLGTATARVRAGVAQRVDSLRASSDLAQRQTALLRAREAVRLSRVELDDAVGTPLDHDRPLESPGEPTAGVPDDAGAFAQAERARPELAVLDASLRENDRRLEAARAGRWPRLTASATAEYVAPNILDDYADWSDVGLKTYKLYAGVALSVPVFDGGATAARVGEASADGASLRARRADLALSIHREVASALGDLRVAIAVWQSDSGRVATSREAMRLAEAGYRGGTSTASDVRDAEAALADALAEEAQSSMDYWIARAELDHALGSRKGN